MSLFVESKVLRSPGAAEAVALLKPIPGPYGLAEVAVDVDLDDVVGVEEGDEIPEVLGETHGT